MILNKLLLSVILNFAIQKELYYKKNYIKKSKKPQHFLHQTTTGNERPYVF